jgi:dynein heavy chain
MAWHGMAWHDWCRVQMSIKITNEAPVGIKAGLKRSYTWVNQDMLDSVPRSEWRSLLFVMCFVHSIVQERRKFGPIGWCIPYEFNQGDLSASVQFIQNHLAEMETKKSKEVTWSTVRYMVSDIQYGGRITDDWDRFLMKTYAEKYFVQVAFDANYQFYPRYKVPQGVDIAVFRKYIAEELPAVDSPEIFGLNMNADIIYRSNQTIELIQTILETQPKTSGGQGGLTREETVNRIAEEMLTKIPNDFKMDDVRESLAKMGASAPLHVFLRQEVDRLQRVMSMTRSTLKDLRLAIAGTIALNSSLIAALNALFDALVPTTWQKPSWQSPTLGLWFAGMLSRHEQVERWLAVGRPKTFWMTGFFNPQGFLTSMQQEVARAHQGWSTMA